MKSSNKKAYQNKEEINLFEFNASTLEMLIKKFKSLSSEIPDKNSPIKKQSLALSKGLEDELRKLESHYEELERMRLQLNQKIEGVEQMEIENLE